MTKITRLEKNEDELPSEIPLTAFSTESLEVLATFGIDAPSKLNEYAMSLEDALIEQVSRIKQAKEEIERLQTLLSENNISYDKSNDSNPSDQPDA